MKIILISLLSLIYSFHGANWGGHKLTLQEAERIMGESCTLKEDKVSQKEEGHKNMMTYLANTSDKMHCIILLKVSGMKHLRKTL